jgi:hypothetical protein
LPLGLPPIDDGQYQDCQRGCPALRGVIPSECGPTPGADLNRQKDPQGAVEFWSGIIPESQDGQADVLDSELVLTIRSLIPERLSQSRSQATNDPVWWHFRLLTNAVWHWRWPLLECLPTGARVLAERERMPYK